MYIYVCIYSAQESKIRWGKTWGLRERESEEWVEASRCGRRLLSALLNVVHNATHCNTLQHTATHCNTLQLAAAPCVEVAQDRCLPCGIFFAHLVVSLDFGCAHHVGEAKHVA